MSYDTPAAGRSCEDHVPVIDPEGHTLSSLLTQKRVLVLKSTSIRSTLILRIGVVLFGIQLTLATFSVNWKTPRTVLPTNRVAGGSVGVGQQSQRVLYNTLTVCGRGLWLTQTTSLSGGVQDEVVCTGTRGGQTQLLTQGAHSGSYEWG